MAELSMALRIVFSVSLGTGSNAVSGKPEFGRGLINITPEFRALPTQPL
jgi:hypothetical protein